MDPKQPVWIDHLRSLADHFDKSDQKSRNLSEEQVKQLGDLALSPMGILFREMADTFDEQKLLLEKARADLAAARETGRQIAQWTWVPCDQTIACSCCGVAWWPDYNDPDADIGDIDDNWHLDGCEFYALWCNIGFGTGRRVSCGVRADHPRTIYSGELANKVMRDRVRARRIVDAAIALRTADRERDDDNDSTRMADHIADLFAAVDAEQEAKDQ